MVQAIDIECINRYTYLEEERVEFVPERDLLTGMCDEIGAIGQVPLDTQRAIHPPPREAT